MWWPRAGGPLGGALYLVGDVLLLHWGVSLGVNERGVRHQVAPVLHDEAPGGRGRREQLGFHAESPGSNLGFSTAPLRMGRWPLPGVAVTGTGAHSSQSPLPLYSCMVPQSPCAL